MFYRLSMRYISSDGSLPASTLVSLYPLSHDRLLAPTVLHVRYDHMISWFHVLQAWHVRFPLLMEAKRGGWDATGTHVDLV